MCNLPPSPSPQVWLIEVNVNPAMHTTCDPLRALLPGVIQETLGETNDGDRVQVLRFAGWLSSATGKWKLTVGAATVSL